MVKSDPFFFVELMRDQEGAWALISRYLGRLTREWKDIPSIAAILLHLQARPGYDGPVLLEQAAHQPPTRARLDQLHNEYAITRQLADVSGVRLVLAKEGTESQPALHGR